MAGSTNIFLDEGATGENVDAQDGVADHETAVLTFSPDREIAVRLLTENPLEPTNFAQRFPVSAVDRGCDGVWSTYTPTIIRRTVH